MNAREMNQEEIKAHIRKLKKFKDKIEWAERQHELGHISLSKLKAIKRKCKIDRENYAGESRIVQYFGKLFIYEGYLQ